MKPSVPGASAGPAVAWTALPDAAAAPAWQHFGWLDWLAFGLVLAGVLVIAARLRRWAGAYARRILRGAEADGRTLWRALHDTRRQAGCPWRDGLSSLLLGGVAAALLLYLGWAGLALCGLCLALAALAWMDARSGLLPDALTLPLMLLGWACGPLPLVVASSASALVWAALRVLAALYRRLRGVDGLGGGDIKYLAALAGWLGIQPTLAVLWGASVLGLVAWALAGGRRGRAYCFGPCLTLAALPVILAMPVVQSGF